ncbi:MAG: DNA polymerase III subunit delta, partial [Planctomycetota bacterium]
ELPEVLDELRTLPFLAPRRAVVVSDAAPFVSAHREAIESYLNAPSKTASLILLLTSFPRNTRLAKLVGKIGEAIECNAPEAGKLHGWLREAAAARGKKISSEAVELLLAYRGAEMGTLDEEIEKLALYVAERDRITGEDVGRLVASTSGAEAFELTNAITKGNAAAALKALAGSITRRGEEFKVLGMIAWYLRRALKASQELSAGKRPALKMPPQHASAFRAMLQRRNLKKLQGDFRKLLNADLAMKTGTNPNTALQQLVVQLCS